MLVWLGSVDTPPSKGILTSRFRIGRENRKPWKDEACVDSVNNAGRMDKETMLGAEGTCGAAMTGHGTTWAGQLTGHQIHMGGSGIHLPLTLAWDGGRPRGGERG